MVAGVVGLTLFEGDPVVELEGVKVPDSVGKAVADKVKPLAGTGEVLPVAAASCATDVA